MDTQCTPRQVQFHAFRAWSANWIANCGLGWQHATPWGVVPRCGRDSLKCRRYERRGSRQGATFGRLMVASHTDELESTPKRLGMPVRRCLGGRRGGAAEVLNNQGDADGVGLALTPAVDE